MSGYAIWCALKFPVAPPNFAVKGIVFNKSPLKSKKELTSSNNSLKVGICSEFVRDSHVVGKLYIKVFLDLLIFS